MSIDFLQVDVFADHAYSGNPLAVFPEPGELSRFQMQAIAREMNLSESTFVSGVADDSYSVRIFTPQEELPFAGHPTIGTAWTLFELGHLSGDEIEQRSDAGITVVRRERDEMWFERSGRAGPDIEDRNPEAARRIARAVGVDASDIGLEARELGRSGRLHPAMSDAGLDQLMVPLRDLGALSRCRPNPELLSEVAARGAYCFTAAQAGRVRARGFFPSVGVAEDPATGSAAAALGLFLADRIGDIRLEVFQGIEIGRPSTIKVSAARGSVAVGGRCSLVLKGSLEALPPER